ncbi:MAG TPA: hypothetical protein VGL40_08970 [Bacillota bacterium]|jgi:hypothetical protein
MTALKPQLQRVPEAARAEADPNKAGTEPLDFIGGLVLHSQYILLAALVLGAVVLKVLAR